MKPLALYRQGLFCDASPRVRGKLVKDERDANPCGLNPTCAGKTLDKHIDATLNQAHPHVCGETLPGKVKHLQDARNAFAFPVWGE